MNRSKYSNPEIMDERLTVAVPANTKAKIFAVANKCGLPASLLMRQAIIAFIDKTETAARARANANFLTDPKLRQQVEAGALDFETAYRVQSSGEVPRAA